MPYRKKRPLPPVTRISSDAQQVARIEYYRVGSWSDLPAAAGGRATAVDELIDAMLRHRADVWPDAPPPSRER
jgi:hypothetical protein